jgi:hypothetical protein
MSPLTTTHLDHGVSPLSPCRRYEQVSVWSATATLPVFVWEGSLGIYLMVKGFKPSPITAGTTAGTTQRVLINGTTGVLRASSLATSSPSPPLAPVTTAAVRDWSGMSAVVQAMLHATSTTQGSESAPLGERPGTPLATSTESTLRA